MTFHIQSKGETYLKTYKTVLSVCVLTLTLSRFPLWLIVTIIDILYKWISCYHAEWQYLAIGSGPDASEVLVFLRHLPGDLVKLHLVVSLPHADKCGDGADNVWWSHSNSAEHNIVSLLSAQNSAATHTTVHSQASLGPALLIQTGIHRFGLASAPIHNFVLTPQ